MALALYDRVQQTGTANTTVSFTLSGSVTGFQSFAIVGNGNTTYYSATDASGNWETGLGTYSTTGPTLTRTTIYQSSNSNAAVTFSGTVNVFVTYPSGKSVNLDASGNASSLGTPASFVGTNITGTASGLSIGGNAATATSSTTQSKSSVSTSIATTAFAKNLHVAPTTAGTLDWNSSTNTYPGVGDTLLLGSATNGPGGGSYYFPFNFEYSSNDGSGNVTQLGVPYGNSASTLWMRGRYSGSWSSWVQFLTSSNYNSYSPTLTGTGASGTWGINVTGNAATATTASNSTNLGGYPPNQTTGAYNIVQRDGNGYIQNNYFYTSGGGSERNSSGLAYVAGFNSSDYYIRSYNAAAVAAMISGQTFNTGGTAQVANSVNQYPNRTDSAWYQAVWSNAAGGDKNIYSAANVGIYSGSYGYIGFGTGGSTWYIGGDPSWGLGSNTGLILAGNLAVPTMYDSNNTGYFCDPTGRSNLYQSTFGGGLQFSGAFCLNGSGANLDNSTGMRLTESYGAVWNGSNSATWHHQMVNGSYLCGFYANGGNYGNGNYFGTGNVIAYYSDERLKTKVKTIDSAIEKVLSLEGFIYVENELARSVGYTNEKEQAGLSAQKVQKVLPQAVSLAPFDMQGVPETGEIISKSGENYLTVDYSRLVPLLIEAIKEQQTQIDELKAQVLKGK